MGVGWGHERRHGEHGGDAEGDAGRRGVAVEPEGNPGDDDNQTGRDVDLDQVVAHGADELDVARQTRVIPYFVKQQQQQSEIIHDFSESNSATGGGIGHQRFTKDGRQRLFTSSDVSREPIGFGAQIRFLLETLSTFFFVNGRPK